MEGAPGHLDLTAIEKAIAEVPGVVEIHGLHVWTIASGFVSLSANLKTSRDRNAQEVIRNAHELVSSGFGVLHTTFQPEIAEEAGCETGSCDETPSG